MALVCDVKGCGSREGVERLRFADSGEVKADFCKSCRDDIESNGVQWLLRCLAALRTATDEVSTDPTDALKALMMQVGEMLREAIPGEYTSAHVVVDCHPTFKASAPTVRVKLYSDSVPWMQNVACIPVGIAELAAKVEAQKREEASE